MTEGIIVAIIGAAGVILAAIIGLFQKNNTPKKNIKIKQRQKGNNNAQIGIQNNYGKGDNHNERNHK